MRGEARHIYYQENTFLFVIGDFDAATVVKLGTRSDAHRRAKSCVEIAGGPIWVNLKAWMRAVFEAKGRYYTHLNDDPSVQIPIHEHFAMMCFEVLFKLRARGMWWKDVESVLEDLHAGVAAADPRWT